MSSFAELAVSRTSILIGFAGMAAILSVGPWLTPALSPDVRGLQLPLGVFGSQLDQDFLGDSRSIQSVSVGSALLFVIAAGLGIALALPTRTAILAGSLLAAGVAANAVAILNHPTLIQAMDIEYEQRLQIVESMNIRLMEEDRVAIAENARVGGPGYLSGDEQRGDLVRGWIYSMRGRWLIVWALLGLMIATPGGWFQRCRTIVAWSCVGVCCGGLLCSRRIMAEVYWSQALRSEQRAEWDAADGWLSGCLRISPEMENLERTWLLAGKLDFLQNRGTHKQQFYRVFQAARERTRPRAVALREDVPWTIKRVSDVREGLVAPPSGFEGNLRHGALSSGIHESLAPNNIAELPLLQIEVLALSDDLSARHPTKIVLQQASRIWAEAGMTFYQKGTVLKQENRIYLEESRTLHTALEAWQRSLNADPTNRYARYFIANAIAGMDPMRIDSVQALSRPLLEGLDDQALKADVLSNLGDACFQSGRLDEARSYYARSFDLYNMPQYDRINYRAQRRLGGL